MRSIDWSQHVVGAWSRWPRALLSTVGMLLHSRHPMFLWWGPELIQFYNDAYMPSFGEGRHPLAMGQPGRACWQEIWPIIGPQIDAVMRDGSASWNEDALVPIYRNGRIEEVYWTYGYSPVFDDDGGIGGTLVVCTETTSRVLAERRARFIRLLAEQATGAPGLTELARVPFQVSRAGRPDLGFVASYRAGAHPGSDGQLIGASGLNEANAKRVEQAVRGHLASASGEPARPSVVEVRVDVQDPSWPEPTTRAVLLRPVVEGMDILVFGVNPRLPLDEAYWELFNQIGEQLERAAARLEAFRVRAAVESERRNLLLQAPVATALLTGPRHVFELANPLYQRIVGYRDVVGKEYLEAFPEIQGTPLAEVLDRVYQRGEPFVTREYRIPLDRTGNGTLEDCFFNFCLEPLRDAGGAVYGMMAVAVDITEQVNARRILEDATEEREKLLLELATANQAKDEFLATVSHELRTPLTAILGWSRLLTGSSDGARIAQGLAVIERNARAQAQLIEDILDVSRIISGKLRVNMRRVEPTALVNAAAETVRPTARAKQIRLVLEVEPALPAMVCDEDRVQQIVWNLLSNAVKFTPPGGDVVLRAVSRGSRVIISVRDTGQGIAPDFLPRVFNRFWQDDTSTTKRHAGLGLGLSIVQHLVELHGGTVTAQSDGVGQGAVFTVDLPAEAQSEAERALDPTPAPNTQVSSAQRLKGTTVLVVDDQDDARQMVVAVLERVGARVTQARSVADALQVLDASTPNVIVSDIAMPVEDGYSFMQRVRARHVPALALTAYARPEDRQRALDAGFREHVAKPVDPNHLIDVVAALSLG